MSVDRSLCTLACPLQGKVVISLPAGGQGSYACQREGDDFFNTRHFACQTPCVHEIPVSSDRPGVIRFSASPTGSVETY